MTVEAGDYIADLDPSAPANTQPVGEANEHFQLVKRVLDTTFQGSVGDLYDSTSGSVFVGPIQTNRQPADIAALAAEIGLNLDNVGTATRIDDLATNSVRRDQVELMTFAWAFNAAVEFFANVDFTGVVPTIDGVDIADINIIDGLDYANRSEIKNTIINSGPSYSTVAEDKGRKLRWNGSGDLALTISGGLNSDTYLITNSTNGVITVDHNLNENFRRGDGNLSPSFTITGRYKTVGIHRDGGAWYVTGEYDEV